MAWTGRPPAKCDLCNQRFHDGHFIDGKTRYGYWAILCCECHYLNGIGFGEGKGQKYELCTGGKLAGEFDKEVTR